MKKTLTLLCLAVLMTVTAMASGPFREHRWESFHGLKPAENSIVFVGNSITNMHDWWEAFGCNHQILNRGTSGGFTTEVLPHLEMILEGHPAKVFIGIGTNDVTSSEPAVVAENIRLIITRIRKESPNTEVYMQSVLPSTSGNRGARIVTLNNLVKPIVEELNKEYGKVTYLDVFNQLVGTDGISFKTYNGKSLAFDNLHPTVIGYGIWCNYIAPQVGSNCVYDINASTLYSGGHGSDSTGDRITCFAQQVVNANDILIIGDEMVSSGEWHEWLQSDKVKNRGLGWGYPGSNIDQLITNASIYFQHAKSVAPKVILVYAGISEASSSVTAANFKTKCQNLINALRKKAPQTKIYFITPLNTPTASYNNNLKSYITQLNSLTSNSNVKVIDATSMNGNAKYFYVGDGGNYFTSYGYAKLSQIIETALKQDFNDLDIKAVTDEECTKNNELYAARKVLGDVLTDAFRKPGKTGTGIGEYSEGSMTELNGKIDAACALLAGTTATAEQLRTAAEELQNVAPSLNLPEAGKYYTICCNYKNANNRYLVVNNGNLASVTTLPSGNAGVWKFTGTGLQSVATPTKYLGVNGGFTFTTTEAPIQFGEGLNAGTVCIGEIFDGGVRNAALNSNGTITGGQFTNGRYDDYNGWSSDFIMVEVEGGEVVDPIDPVDPPVDPVDPKPTKTYTLGDKVTSIDEVVDGGVYAIVHHNAPGYVTYNTENHALAGNSEFIDGTTAFVFNGDNENGFTIKSAVADRYFPILSTTAGTGNAIALAESGDKFTVVDYDDNVANGIQLRSMGSSYNGSTANVYLNSGGGTSAFVGWWKQDGGNSQMDLYKVTVAEPEPEKFQIVESAGTFSNTASASSFHDCWTSTQNNPQIVVNVSDGAPANNMIGNATHLNDGLVCYSGSQRGGYKCTMTVSTNTPGYTITGYSFKVSNLETGYELVVGDGTSSVTTSATPQEIAKEDLNATSFAITIDGSAKEYNKGALFTEFYVYYKYEGGEEPVGPEEGEETTYTIDKNNGRWTASNGNGTWASTWTSTDNKLKFTASANNMAWSGDNIDARCGTAGTSTYAIEPADKNNYVITGYSLKLHSNGASSENWTINDKSYTSTSTTDVKEINVTGIEERRVEFTETGTNAVGTLLYDFTVTMQYKPRDPSEVDYDDYMTVFDTHASPVPYRIPAVGQTKDGDLVFVADYRYSHADIGAGTQLDLRFRKQYADGHWGEVKTLAAYIPQPFCAFGDPCIVCDRESNRVMVTSCCGNVGFPGGTYNNHQGWARWYSEDGGETWESTYTDLAPQVVAWLDKRKNDQMQAFFIGSGKISQSSTVKVGKYYRLYCASNTRMQSGKCNFVWYSDDFGETWNMLGDPDVKPINGGDEPKADEMPDGSVVVSSRDSGRIFNVYHYTNIATGEGYWGKQTTSSSNNKGCFGASCNGEIMFVPVTRVEDGAKTYLALQSVPMSGSRVNVGIYWKDLKDLSYYRTSTELAPNWTAYQISETTSAYSTMCQMQDGHIAFFYEENGHNDGYDMVYKKFDISKITKGKYTYSVLTDEEKAEYLSNGVDPYFEGKTLSEKLAAAIEAYKADPTYANYEVLNEAVQNPGGDDPTPAEAGNYYIRLDGTDLYFSTTEVADNAQYTYSISAEKEAFVVTPSADGFTIQSLDTDKFVGYNHTNTWDFSDDEDVWYIESFEEPTAILKDGSQGFGVDDQFDGAGVYTDKIGQLWVFEPAEVVGINVLRPELQNAIRFDLQGRRINGNARGIVLQNGSKKLTSK